MNVLEARLALWKWSRWQMAPDSIETPLSVSPRLASPGLSGHPTSNQSMVSGCPENLLMTRMMGLVIRGFSADRYIVDGGKMMLLCYEGGLQVCRFN